MSNLISLDFSGSSSLRIPDLGMFVGNMSSLRKLRLNGLNLSMSGWEQLFSSPQLHNLQVLSLSGCGLSGPITMSSSLANLSSLSVLVLSDNDIEHFPKEMFNLPNLQVLDLTANIRHNGSLPEFQNSSSLEELILSSSKFSGTIPPSIGNLKRLTKLDLTLCGFSGEFPSNSFSNLSKLVWLSLQNNYFSGSLPSIKSSSRTIGEVDFSYNKFTGPIHDSYVDGLPKLSTLDLSNNLLTGSIPSSIFSKLPSLWLLDLCNNQLHGELEEFERPASSQLEYIILCGNLLEGRIIHSFFKLPNLKTLHLYSNRFQGVLNPQMFMGNNNLTDIDFSDNRMLTIDQTDTAFTISNLVIFDFSSCNLTRFPSFLKHQKASLVIINLGNNQLTGKVPAWIWNITQFLNISNNLLDGFERSKHNFSSSSLWSLDLRSNMFSGPIPDLPTTLGYLTLSDNYFTQLPGSICNSRSLRLLDLSNNRITGSMPSCLGKLVSLEIIDLGKNKFSGSFDQEFDKACSLLILNMNGNQIEGMLPRSLANCRKLLILDLGNNRMDDTFPFWLESLLSLEVLILQSNNFHDTISGSRDFISNDISFPSLHIIDLSSNYFTGPLPMKYFKSSRAMTMPNEGDEKYQSALSSNRQFFYYGYSLMLANKGQEMRYFYEILYILSAIDLSCNKFEGDIPELIGDFMSLVVLNLSYNNLKDKIPSSLGNLSGLQSLDLSNNNLSGEIPPELTSLTFLSLLNVSRNKLVGMIPSGFQFSTFNSSSFEGNLGLCGFPLNIKCNRHGDNGPPPFSSSKKATDVPIFDWKFAIAGLGAGFVIGVVIEHLILMRNMYYLANFSSVARFIQGFIK